MGHLTMSDKERLSKALFEMVRLKKLTLIKVVDQLELSYRQVQRNYQKYLTEGDAGLVHKARGRESNRRHPHRDQIIHRYQERYEDFGPTFAAEKLLGDGFKVNHETLRCWLLSEGIWSKKRKRKPYRQRRERKAQFGEMVQLDGSFSDWFEEGCDSSKYKCLLNMVDDATSISLPRLETGETTAGVFRLLWKWIELYGIPLSLYVDRKTVYVALKKEGSHVQRVCKKLGIRIIKARSAQAKGRVERNHAIYQDRYIKELRLQDIKTIDGGNNLLYGGFVDNLNNKFSKPPRNPDSAHRSAKDCDLYNIFCWEYDRVVNNDWTISFQNKIYQIEKRHADVLHPGKKVIVRRHMDNAISVYYNDKELSVKLIPERPAKPEKPRKERMYTPSECGKLGRQHSPWDNRMFFDHHERLH